MHIEHLIQSLTDFPAVLRPLVEGLSAEQAKRKPASGAWSVLEIVTHLADEEAEDFRMRVRMTLEDPAQPWPGIDPEGAAIERKYNEGDLSEALSRFLREREVSIGWLKGLDDPQWESAYEHPKFGPIHAGDVMSSWAAHDLLHLRQITKRRFELVQEAGEPFSTDYAGEWPT